MFYTFIKDHEEIEYQNIKTTYHLWEGYFNKVIYQELCLSNSCKDHKIHQNKSYGQKKYRRSQTTFYEHWKDIYSTERFVKNYLSM